jgi:hypothetical protein
MDAGELLLRQSALNTGKRLKPLEEARAWKRIMRREGMERVAARRLSQEAAEHRRRSARDSRGAGDLPAAVPRRPRSARPRRRLCVSSPRCRRACSKRALDAAQDNWRWEDAVTDGKSVPVKDCRGLLDDIILGEELREIEKDLRDQYQGEVVRVGKKDYAVNIDAYDKLVEKREAAKAKGSTGVHRRRSQLAASRRRTSSSSASRSRRRRKSRSCGARSSSAISRNLPTVISDSLVDCRS